MVRFSQDLISILALSSASGFMLYWITFVANPAMSSFLPSLQIPSGLIGAVVAALFYLGISSAKKRGSDLAGGALTLVRDGSGRVRAINRAGLGREVVVHRARPTQGGMPVAVPTRVGIGHARTMAVVATVAIISGGYISAVALLGTFTPFMVVSGQSMQPALSRGDLVIVRAVQAHEVEIGDIIAFNAPSPFDKVSPSPIIHRVTGKWVEGGEVYFKTMGDAIAVEDPYAVPAKNVTGEYVWKIPYIGLILLDPFNLVLIGVLFVVILFLIVRLRSRVRGSL